MFFPCTALLPYDIPDQGISLELWTVIPGFDDTAPRTAKATGRGWRRKGSQVYVEGRIRSREYEVDRKTRCSLDVSVSRVQFLGSARPTSKDVDEVLKPHAPLIFEVDGCQSHWLLSLSRIVERSQIGQTMSHRTVLEVPVQGVWHVLHDDVGGAVFDLEVIGRGDVGVVKTSGESGFALEGVQVLGVIRDRLVDDLNGDGTVQHGVAGTVDSALAASGYPLD